MTRGMTRNLKASITVVIVVVGVLGVLLFVGRPSSPPAAAPQPAAAVAADLLVRSDSHRLTTAGGRVTFVEFLDFECEACGAAYPAIERLRSEYGERVTFVVRYFPLPGHANSETAAVAVEAAAGQGAFEKMYQRMFQAQSVWGEQRVSQAPLFRQFAGELGLDLVAYDRAVADPATLERVRADKRDGLQAGVGSTPTFFLDGQRLQPRSFDELRASIERALAR